MVVSHCSVMVHIALTVGIKKEKKGPKTSSNNALTIGITMIGVQNGAGRLQK
jgi:hypothetical protein